MLGFKRFDHAAVTISGIELAEKIKKGQPKTGKQWALVTRIAFLRSDGLVVVPIDEFGESCNASCELRQIPCHGWGNCVAFFSFGPHSIDDFV